MLKKLIKLYHAYMLQDVRSPLPHLVGPPGVGKSEAAEKLAELVGKRLHILNVSRINPLELEGAQVPHGKGSDLHLKLLHNPLWKDLKHGDVVLMDEFLRGFPEVYNALLDILTSRHVAGFDLPRVFVMAASNSVVTYDSALEDRLLHLFVPDIRSNKTARMNTKELLIQSLNLYPKLINYSELDDLLAKEVDSMYELLDRFKKDRKSIGSTSLKGSSVRNLIGQYRLREIKSVALKELLALANTVAIHDGKFQYVGYWGQRIDEYVIDKMRELLDNKKVQENEVQYLDLQMSLALYDMNHTASQTSTEIPEGDIDDPDFF